MNHSSAIRICEHIILNASAADLYQIQHDIAKRSSLTLKVLVMTIDALGHFET